jgi:hypothetical protein
MVGDGHNGGGVADFVTPGELSFCGRACGADGSAMVPISAMLLHDACHSIDSPHVGPILENIKFPNSADT